MKWISVKDKLPNKRAVFGHGLSIIVATEEDVFATTYTSLGWANLNGRTVTHWMELPKPPKS